MEAAVAHASPEYVRLARKARLLSWASLAYMAAEGFVAIAAGIAAGSIALIGFGHRLRDRGLRERRDRLAIHRLAHPLPRG